MSLSTFFYISKYLIKKLTAKTTQVRRMYIPGKATDNKKVKKKEKTTTRD